MTDKGFSLRAIVLGILSEYEKTGEKLDRLIKNTLDSGIVPEKKDRSFIKLLTEGTVERRITLDHVIDRFSTVRTEKMKSAVRNVLRMGTYQLLYMDSVPAHAVINESVRLIKKRHMAGLAGFVNAVLRSIEASGTDPGTIEDPAVRYSFPEWLYEKLSADLGKEKALTVMEASLGRRPLYIRVNITKTDPADLKQRFKERGIDVKGVEDMPFALEIKDVGDMTSLTEFKEGLFSVQDLSSMSVGAEAGEIINKERPESFKVLDLCASPGGKSCHVSEILTKYAERHGLERAGFSVVSRDISESKTAAIEENRERLGLDIIKTHVFDAREREEIPENERADLIIADLPCSGLGVIGRKSDIKYRVKPEDIAALQELQRQILLSGDASLKEGAYLIFSVCTISREETFDQAEWIERELGYGKISEKLMLPEKSGSDGFYYAVFKKGKAQNG